MTYTKEQVIKMLEEMSVLFVQYSKQDGAGPYYAAASSFRDITNKIQDK